MGEVNTNGYRVHDLQYSARLLRVVLGICLAILALGVFVLGILLIGLIVLARKSVPDRLQEAFVFGTR